MDVGHCTALVISCKSSAYGPKCDAAREIETPQPRVEVAWVDGPVGGRQCDMCEQIMINSCLLTHVRIEK